MSSAIVYILYILFAKLRQCFVLGEYEQRLAETVRKRKPHRSPVRLFLSKKSAISDLWTDGDSNADFIEHPRCRLYRHQDP